MAGLRDSETLAAEFEGGRHGGAKVSVGPMHGGQYELGRAGVGSRHRHVSVRGVGEVNDDRRHRREVRSAVDKLQHVLQTQLACIQHNTVPVKTRRV